VLVAVTAVAAFSGAAPALAAPTRPGRTGSICHGQPIVVGEDVALSGAFSLFGTPDTWGVRAYNDYLNSIGGVDGCHIRVVQENNQSVPSLAAQIIRKLVLTDHAQFIFGPEDTAADGAAIPFANALHVVLFAWGSGWNYPGLDYAQLHSYAFPGIIDVYAAENVAITNEVIVPHHWTRVAVLMDATPGADTVARLERQLLQQKQYRGIHVVASQFVQVGQTDDTPEVLNLLAAHPQIILDGLAPGQDAITAIKAIRAQSPTMPFGVCSACTTPAFVQAVGGPSVMKDIWSIGTTDQVLQVLPRTKANQPTIRDIGNYYTWMRRAGFTSADQLNGGLEGWDTMEELVAAIRTAHSVDDTAVKNAMAHQTLDTLGVVWHRTPKNYFNYIDTAFPLDITLPNGTFVPIKLPAGS
jgi:ABC-type branched-subunit amino acid transport system substrate-binding protein